MTCKQAAQQICQVIDNEHLNKDSLVVAILRLGSPTQSILSMTLGELADIDDSILGGPLHSLVIPGGSLHDLEREMLEHFKL